MIVIDALAMVEALVGPTPDPALLDALAGDIAAPTVVDIEVLSALRGLELGRKLTPDIATQARADFFDFTITRHDIEPLAERIWALRRAFTAYDAAYLALAEALDAPLLTCDSKLAARGHKAQIQLVAAPA